MIVKRFSNYSLSGVSVVFAVATMMFVVALLLIFLLESSSIPSSLKEPLSLLFGIFLGAGTNIIKSIFDAEYTDAKALRKLIRVDSLFAITAAALKLDMKVDEAKNQLVLDDFPKKSKYEILPKDFLGKDNNLALAKLRIDLEKEMLITADRLGFAEDDVRLDFRRFLGKLTEKKIISPAYSEAYAGIYKVCSQAIHGYDIDTKTATQIVLSASELIVHLRTLAIVEAPLQE